MSDITSITVWDRDNGATTVDLNEVQVGMVRDFQTIIASEIARVTARYLRQLEVTGMDYGTADELLCEALGAIVENGTVDYLPRD